MTTTTAITIGLTVVGCIIALNIVTSVAFLVAEKLK